MNRSALAVCVAVALLFGAGVMLILKKDQRQLGTVTEKSFVEKRNSPITRSQTSTGKRTDSKWLTLTDDSVPEAARIKLAQEIDWNMATEDVEMLLDSLGRVPAGHAKESWWLVMNEIMEQVRKKSLAPDRLGPVLISLIEDPNQPEVVRDYAVQHLSLWVSPVGSAQGEPSTEVVGHALNVIASTVTDPSIAHSSIPGTAIMSLTAADRHLAPETIAPVWQSLDPVMTSMLKGEVNVPLSTRTTVIQALAMRGSRTHLPLVREMARDESIDPSMRLSSIAALGIYGSSPDEDYLATLADGTSKYRYAAKAALERIRRHDL